MAATMMAAADLPHPDKLRAEESNFQKYVSDAKNP